jgi:hypothetical protein
MALTAEQKRARNAGYQARWRARRNALARGHTVMTLLHDGGWLLIPVVLMIGFLIAPLLGPLR